MMLICVVTGAENFTAAACSITYVRALNKLISSDVPDVVGQPISQGSGKRVPRLRGLLLYFFSVHNESKMRIIVTSISI